MGTSLSAFVRALLEPADALLDPGRRVYWAFLAGSVAIAAVALVLRGVSVTRAARALFAPRIWLHRSARLDYQLILAKAVVRVALLGSFGLSMLAVAGITASWLRRHAGLPALNVSPVVAGVVFTLVAFLAEDWSRFYVHRLMHRVPLLWEFHKVHHSAEVLTPFSLYRTHPVESLLNAARGALALGLVTGACVWAFGPALPAWQVLGVDAIGFVWTLLGANLRHSHVWLSYGARLEKWLVSPAQHQVHHSTDPRHVDKNFGTVLAVWDWLGGSLYVTSPRRREALRYGLPASEPHPGRSVGALLAMPFVAAARHAAVAVAGTAGSRQRQRAAVALLVCFSLSSAECTPPTPRLDRAALLQSFGRCTLDTYRRFQTTADALTAATAAHAAAPADATQQTAARAAWEQAIDVWEVAEMLRYGPAADLTTLGGRGLREQVYSWPDVNRCLIEQQIVSQAYANIANVSASTRGLAAIEYLLFYTGADNACPATDPINAMGTWAAIAPDELARRKAAYAAAAATDVAARAREIVADWERPGDGFLAQLTTAGNGSTLFATQQLAISAVAEAAFYLDTDVKDARLGRPLGLTPGSMGDLPSALESQWADRGRRHLRNNLAGLRLLLEGCAAGNSLGFDDLLEAAGAGMLATQMRADLTAAEAAVDAIPGNGGLIQPLASNRDSLVAAHTAVRELTNFLKMEFSATLQIRSTRVEGDTD